MRDIIFLDMDGVLVDWDAAVYALYGQKPPARSVRRPWDTEKVIGTTSADMWARINANGPDWWEFLDPYPWFAELHDELKAMGPELVILTAPCDGGNSSAGKVRWLNRHLGRGTYRLVMTKHKDLLAAPGRVLVDDGDHNADAFDAAGGHTVLLPQPWNRAPEIDEASIVPYVCARVRQAFLPAGVLG